MVHHTKQKQRLITFCLYLGFATSAFSQNSLYNNFLSPPPASRPRVWWHWLDGNITKEGIRKDLLWMKKSGIQGVHNFDVFRGTPTIVGKRINFMSAEWKGLFKYAVNLADSLGMEFAIASSPGWSQTGGPWVEPKNAMKKLVWREMRIEGGQFYKGALPNPHSSKGLFQNVSAKGNTNIKNNYYRDIATLAIRLPNEDVDVKTLHPRIISSSGEMSLSEMTDDDFSFSSIINSDSKGDKWIEYVFPTPTKIASLSISDGRTRGKRDVNQPNIDKVIEVSDDGSEFKEIAQIPNGGSFQNTVSLPITTTSYLRVRYVSEPQNTEIKISEFKLFTTTRVNHFEEKAGFAITADDNEYPTPDNMKHPSTEDVLDISNYVDQSGNLSWNVPQGNWCVLRIGYSLTGKTNNPAVPEATGLEVDKLDSDAIKAYYQTYLSMYKDASGGKIGQKGIQYILNDSYEAGPQNWTEKMPEEFKRRRGYDLLKWLPVLTGTVINSGHECDKFLWDWRKTIAEMIADYDYDVVSKLLKGYNLKRYSESQELGRVYLVDGMDAKRTADVPMSAFWIYPKSNSYAYPTAEADIKESSSVAHIYGQNIAAAESFTCNGLTDGAWVYCPENLKPMADVALWCGLNRFVVHTSPHQPLDNYFPGLGLGKYGQWFDRHETWADYAKNWSDYLSRSCYMLQQGHYVADIAYYYGEDNSITGLYYKGMPTNIPQGFNYDFVNSDALLHKLHFDKGNLATDYGTTYRMLVLDKNVKYMSMQVLKKINEFANQGILIIGYAPQFCANLNADPEEFKQLVKDIWFSGRKNVSTDISVDNFLKTNKIESDLNYLSASPMETRFVHRKSGNTDIYWINNYKDTPQSFFASFRIYGKKPQIWHPDNGKIEDVSYEFVDGRTKIKMNMEAYDALFIMFDKVTSITQSILPEKKVTPMITVNNPWEVSFQEGRGAPQKVMFNKLKSFTESDNENIRYFSGKATYQTSFILPNNINITKKKLFIDLGIVKNIAEVYINGFNAGVVWKSPFLLDISRYVHKGKNLLSIKITNLWVNRLIGDTQPDTKIKITNTAMEFYKPTDPLLPSGLIGPVRIIDIQ